jgi:probable phosphoglycerate mutase
VVLVRHGETDWSNSGKHTGRTDVPLTAAGEEQATLSRPLIRGLLGDLRPYVISSPRRRAIATAMLTGYPPDEVTELAAEWDYGQLEGLTTSQIRERFANWSIWVGPVPGGEDATTVTDRVDSLLVRIAQLRTETPDRPVLVFSHGHACRCIAARWIGEPIAAGRFLWLQTAAVSSLGFEHDSPVVLRWNIDSTIALDVDSRG